MLPRMSAALRRPMTVAEFLDWEAARERPSEFDGFAPVAMVGVTRAHAAIQRNLTIAVGTRLRGKPCRFYGPEIQVRPPGTVRYPDGVVTCTPGGPRDRVLDAPVVLFEILSESTAATDRTDKAREYRAIPSVRRYVMLAQDRAAAEMHVRDGDRWLSVLLFEGDVLDMPEIGVAVPMAELYEEVEFPPREAEAG